LVQQALAVAVLQQELLVEAQYLQGKLLLAVAVAVQTLLVLVEEELLVLLMEALAVVQQAQEVVQQHLPRHIHLL
jgi:hypothetical protein